LGTNALQHLLRRLVVWVLWHQLATKRFCEKTLIEAVEKTTGLALLGRDNVQPFHRRFDSANGFHLLLHPEKTRPIEFGKGAIAARRAHGLGKPATFDFLGFTHFCGTRRDGTGFVLGRKPVRKQMRARLRAIREMLRQLLLRWQTASSGEDAAQRCCGPVRNRPKRMLGT
jgi:hypothetical protein